MPPFENLKLPSYILPEVFATFIYCYFTQMLCPTWIKIAAMAAPLFTGLLVYVIILLNHTAAIVHFNPAITISFFASRKIKIGDFFWYLVAQIFGGILGSGMCYLTVKLSLEADGTWDKTSIHNNSTSTSTSTSNIILDQNSINKYNEIISSYALDVNPEKTSWLAILISEAITSLVMCLTATLCCYNTKTWTDKTGALCIGLTVFLGISTGLRIGAGCLNPIRTMMPWFLDFRKICQNWTLIVGPSLGAMGSGLIFNFYFDEQLADEAAKRELELENRPCIEEEEGLNLKNSSAQGSANMLAVRNE